MNKTSTGGPEEPPGSRFGLGGIWEGASKGGGETAIDAIIAHRRAIVGAVVVTLGSAGSYFAKIPSYYIEAFLGFLVIALSIALLRIRSGNSRSPSSAVAKAETPSLPVSPILTALSHGAVSASSAITVSVAKLERINQLFGLIADNNRDTDKQLFDVLSPFMFDDIDTQLRMGRRALRDVWTQKEFRIEFENFLDWGDRQVRLRRDQCELACDLIDENLSFIVNCTSAILSIYTGADCAACLKVLKRVPASRADVLNVPVWTRYRCARSLGNHHRMTENKKEWLVSQNTITKVVFHDHKDYWGHDNLKALGPLYFNERKEWSDDYNATIGVAVHSLTPSDTVPFCGLLCADNKVGGLNDNNICTGYMQELAARIAVMLYRAGRLAGEHVQDQNAHENLR